MKNEAAIRELIDGFVKAIRDKDMNGVMSVFAPEFVSFDIGPPLQHGGGETFRKRWQDDVAFSHSLNRIGGTMKNGQKTDRWLRWTAGYRKVNDKWLIVHEQVSVPVGFASKV